MTLSARDLAIIDKLNNARQIARTIQAEMADLIDNPALYTCDVDCERTQKSAVRIEELLAEATQLLRGEIS